MAVVDAIPWIVILVLADIGLLRLAIWLRARRRYDDVDEYARKQGAGS